MTQGYLTLATGDRRFFDAAVNVALSVRLNDEKRPISLLCDDPAKLSEQEKTVLIGLLLPCQVHLVSAVQANWMFQDFCPTTRPCFWTLIV